MRRFWALGALYLTLLAVQLWSKTDHRLLAMTAFAGLVLVWVAIWHQVTRHGPTLYWIGTAVFAVALLAAVAVPPATSKDFNSYALYGQMVAKYNASPYTHEPVDFAADAWYPRTSYFWTDSPSVYGPAFTAISAGVMKVSGDSVPKARLGFQGVAAVSLLGCIALVARRIGKERAVALIGLNPLLITFGVNDAHCDLLIGLCIVAAVLAVERQRWIQTGVFIGLAAMVKVAALPALAGAVAWTFFRDAPLKARVTNSIVVVLSAAITAGAFLFAAGGPDSLRPLHQAASRHTRFSVWNPIHQLVAHVTNADSFVSVAANLTVFVVAVALILKHRRDGSAVIAVVVGLVSYQVLGAYVLAWYAAWSLPALAIVPTSRTMIVAMGHASWVAIAYFSGYGVLVITAGVAIWAVSHMFRNRATLGPERPAMMKRSGDIIAERKNGAT